MTLFRNRVFYKYL